MASSTPSFSLVQVAVKSGRRDPTATLTANDLEDALPNLSQSKAVQAVRFVQGYALEGVSAEDAARAAAEVLADPVTQDWSVAGIPGGVGENEIVLTVLRRPGVTDPVEASCRRALAAVGIDAPAIRTFRRYVVHSTQFGAEDLKNAAAKVLANEVIEEIQIGAEVDPHLIHPRPYGFELRHVALNEVGDAELERISRDNTLSLSLLEMRAVQAFFREQGREPTDIELETLAQTWSEHCKHKTLAGAVDFRGPDGETRSYENLLKETVFHATQQIGREDCLSVFVDNAGVIAFDDENGVCMKVETHNHPSAIEPYGGAGTGIGGVIRDILGTGLGAKPFLNTDVFCFAPPDMHPDDVPPGSLHPLRVMHGVVAGVRDYGNRMGIPTASGGLFFDQRYVGNPIVYCGTLGLIPRDRVEKAARPGDVIVAVGGRTGRDGIHGATFSSVELHEESETVSAGAVQIGNPIEEKRVLDGLLQVRDEGLVTGLTDCGAGGFSSAVGEMAEQTGARVHLDRAPLKYAGLSYDEIWISEAQERMVLAVPPAKVPRVRAIFEAEGVEVTELGEFTDSGRLELFFRGTQVCDLPLSFVHDGLPRIRREATWDRPRSSSAIFPWERYESRAEGEPPESPPLDTLLATLGSWNCCSKEWVIRQYDHEVQGGSVVKPLVGVRSDGPSDATVVTPIPGNPRGVAVASGMNPLLGDLSPYDMATNAVDEALRNLCAVGVDPRQAALLDNFSWGNTNKPDRLGSILLASEGLRDAALAFGTPFVSGKDSLNNEYQVGGETIVIPPTLLVSAFAVVPDVTRCVTMDLKQADSALYVVGTTRAEMGGSHVVLTAGLEGGTVPRVRFEESAAVLDGVHAAIAAGTVRACHDVNEGGFAAALAEMAFAGCLGVDADLGDVPDGGEPLRVAAQLFSESPGRFVCEVCPGEEDAFVAALGGAPHARVGTVTEGDGFRLRVAGKLVLEEELGKLRATFIEPLFMGARKDLGVPA